MKPKTQLYLVNSKDVSDGIARASGTVGTAIRAWLAEEIRLGALDFSDVAMALHVVVAQESAIHALSKCRPRNAKNMKKQYSDLVALCLDHQFEKMIEIGKNEF